MVDDLRRQASEIYRERNKDGALRTSDSRALKKMTYIAVGLAIFVLIVIQLSGGFEPRPDPVVAAATPAPLVKEEPSPEMLEPIEGDSTSGLLVPADNRAPEPKAEPAAVAKTAPAATAKPARASGRVVKKPSQPKKQPASSPVPAPVVDGKEPVAGQTETEPETPEIPAEPEIGEEEIARRELARDLTIQKSAAMAELIVLPGNQNWEAAQSGNDSYLVTFIIMDESQPLRYVWRVNISSKSVTPLSYYAKKLP